MPAGHWRARRRVCVPLEELCREEGAPQAGEALGLTPQLGAIPGSWAKTSNPKSRPQGTSLAHAGGLLQSRGCQAPRRPLRKPPTPPRRPAVLACNQIPVFTSRGEGEWPAWWGGQR